MSARRTVQGSLLAIALTLPLVSCGHDVPVPSAPSAVPEAPGTGTDPIDGPDDPSDIDEAEVPGAVSISPNLLDVQTYDGSGQSVHPDAVVMSRRWNQRRYWVVATPYPGGDAQFENPSIFSGSSVRELTVPAGATNPLFKPQASSYLSDPDMVFDPERNELRMYYRQVTPMADQLYFATSRDGSHWSSAKLSMNAGRYRMISPSIVREASGSWRMWGVNAGPMGCQARTTDLSLDQRRSTDGITWGPAEPVQLQIPGRVPWHWDVQYVAAKGEYWALVAAYPDGHGCSRTAVYFARSADGTSWTVSPMPLLDVNEFEPVRDLVYRSTFHYHPGSDVVSVWFSGGRVDDTGLKCAVVSARYSYADLLARVTRGSGALLGLEPSPAHAMALSTAREKFERNFP